MPYNLPASGPLVFKKITQLSKKIALPTKYPVLCPLSTTPVLIRFSRNHMELQQKR